MPKTHPKDKWLIHIDIVGGICNGDANNSGCLYCSRYTRYWKPHQRYVMPKEQVVEEVHKLKDFKNTISFMGGEPLFHPDFKELTLALAKVMPKKQRGLWTSGFVAKNEKWSPKLHKFCKKYYGKIAHNDHQGSKMTVCEHQPLSICPIDAVPDSVYRQELIDNCVYDKRWCGLVNVHKPGGEARGWFCEVAGSLAHILELDIGIKTYPDWINAPAEAFEEQRKTLCPLCGMCLPQERDTLDTTKEKISPTLYKMFSEAGLPNLDKTILVDKPFTKEDIEQHSKSEAEQIDYRQDKAKKG